ncbi:M1 family metallopeptidase [Adhaeribacter pallidiroseus]|uniref:Aminopeptidase N n=1 Tax=Adhaeribacter pallidiroseus TaxID=2072847 RepID=A0A369QDX5_9BACT|nr:M1 family metallopeptidase [Adhaeribacter pallidiroseus]RDC63111.1 Leukotriene-A(4) hydrolase [Adhaeribacter pallidiroseus]
MLSHQTLPVQDPHSFAQPQAAMVTHLQLHLQVDFAAQTLTGEACYTIHKAPKATRIILDVQDLIIQQVLADGYPTPFTLGAVRPYIGQPLEIELQDNTAEITIIYQTPPGAAALQWLAPEQTAGGKFPFLFTQSQAILARTWLPCQDSPAIRFTYTAQVQVPVGFLALMSAHNPQESNETGRYSFTMPYPIPSYLMALAVGHLEFKKIGTRTGVYAEPAMLSAAADEFSEMENMLLVAEQLYGAYPWGRYDLLVLPPSFPFGGMENPCLTFATPTIITGDRSLTSLVAHELAHSWSGNLVTNATWNDFWLNEGFTVYFERRIMENVYGADYADMLKVLGFQDLLITLNELGPTNPDTCLKLHLANRDPDDGLTEIAYEKGNLFLLTLENVVGRPRFDAFITEYFKNFKFQSNTTEYFLEFLLSYFSQEKDLLELRVKPENWIYQPGLPDTAIQVKSARLTLVEEVVHNWFVNPAAAGENTHHWTTHEWLYCFHLIKTNINPSILKVLDATFHFTESKNAEIAATWFEMGIKADYQPISAALEEFLMKVGRRKFVLPLYRLLAQNSSGKEKAQQIFKKARANYHAVTRQSVEKLLGL